MKVRVKDRQTLLDVALATGGDVEGAMALAVANGLSLTERLSEGQVLDVPGSMVGLESRVARLYGVQGIEPATEASADEAAACPFGGVGLMGIGVDFEVS